MARPHPSPWAVVLAFAVLGTMIQPGSSLYRISCKENPNLNMAIIDNKVVLAQANIADPRQTWAWDFPNAKIGKDGFCERPFQLYNLATLQVLVIPSDGSLELKLAPFNISRCAPLSTLWVTRLPQPSDGFLQVKAYKDESLSLNALYQPIHEGTPLGIYYSDPITANAEWKLNWWV